MAEPQIFLTYIGPVDFARIESLLKKLKKTGEYKALNTTTGKRVYSIFVECLENIYKHSDLKLSNSPGLYPQIIIIKENDKVIIKAGNPVLPDDKDNISARLERINRSDEKSLQAQYEYKITSDLKDDEKCAGLGFIYMALKSGNKIFYSFKPLRDGYLYFEIQVTINKYIMRKLIIDQTSSSPKVVLDPEKKIFIIAGESRPADVGEFYGRILAWLGDFNIALIKSDDKKDALIFNFNFGYFNSSSAKLILDMCKILAGLRLNGFNVSINWHFEKEDEDMLEAGKEMSKIVKIPFEFVES